MRHLLSIVLFAAGCTTPAIETYCNADEEGVDCSFSNVGGTGSICVNVTLVRNDGKASTKTDKPVCSGELAKLDTANVRGTFSDPQPGEVCKTEEGDLSWDLCELKVKTIE